MTNCNSRTVVIRASIVNTHTQKRGGKRGRIGDRKRENIGIRGERERRDRERKKER